MHTANAGIAEDDVRTRGDWLGTELHEALQHGKVIYVG
jgi:hypothetical protein